MKRLFIVGVGRSGTSLLQSMMSAHSQIVMMPETSFLRRYLVGPKYKKTIPVNIGNKEFLSDKYLQRWKNDGAVDDKWISKEIPANVFYQKVVNCYANKKKSEDVEYVGEKDPKLIEVLPLLSRLVDDYLVLHIIRDPRDVVLSKNKAVWSMKQPLLKKIIANVSQISIAKKFKKKNPFSICELHYEDLLKNPEKTLGEICCFLGLSYESNMLDFQKEAAHLVAKDELSWKKETLGPLLKTNLNKWQTEMSGIECVLIEKCCSQAMRSGDYKYSGFSLTPWQKVKVSVISVFVNMISSLYVLYLTYLRKAYKG